MEHGARTWTRTEPQPQQPGLGHRPRTTCQIPNPIFALSVCCLLITHQPVCSARSVSQSVNHCSLVSQSSLPCCISHQTQHVLSCYAVCDRLVQEVVDLISSDPISASYFFFSLVSIQLWPIHRGLCQCSVLPILFAAPLVSEPRTEPLPTVTPSCDSSSSKPARCLQDQKPTGEKQSPYLAHSPERRAIRSLS